MSDKKLNNSPLNSEELSTQSVCEMSEAYAGSIAHELMNFYIHRAGEVKSKADQLGAEIQQRQDKMRLINDIIAEINNLTDEKNSLTLDIAQNAELLEKLQVAKNLGVNIKEGQLKFDALARDRLIENLHLSGDNWDKENRNQTQKMEILVKELDRLIMLIKDIDKKEEQSKRPILAGIKGN